MTNCSFSMSGTTISSTSSNSRYLKKLKNLKSRKKSTKKKPKIVMIIIVILLKMGSVQEISQKKKKWEQIAVLLRVLWSAKCLKMKRKWICFGKSMRTKNW
ncbi:hypothetical protein Csa_015547 [Cucumis sativus]|nr:hypothetical protein Csa_015547 [Cucumis sativus]